MIGSSETERVDSRSRSPLLGPLLALVSLLLGLCLLEVGFRVYHAWSPQQDASLLVERGQDPETQRNTHLRFQDIIQLSENAEQIFELRPGVTGQFKGASLAINMFGSRGPAIRIPRPSDVDLRVVALGDSVCFGWGVEEQQAYARQLEALAHEHFPELATEVINLGVPGYNTYQESAYFSNTVEELQPDVVLLLLNGNDSGLPNFLGQPKNSWALDRSFLVDFISNSVLLLQTDRQELLGFGKPGQLVRTRDIEIGGEKLKAGDLESAQRALDEVPPAYRKMVGDLAAEKALERLAQEALAVNAEVIVASYYPVSRFGRAMLSKTEALNWTLVDIGPKVETYLEATETSFEQLLLGPEDLHPGAVYHRLIAEAFFDQGLRPWLTQRTAES